MWSFTRNVWWLLLSISLWRAASAEPWIAAEPPDPQPSASFIPKVFAESAADGYWAWGSVVQRLDQGLFGRGLDRSTDALIRFDADGQQQARAFDGFLDGLAVDAPLLKRLPDGGVLFAATRLTDTPFPFSLRLCQVVRIQRDGRTQWQAVLEGGACLAADVDGAGGIWVAIDSTGFGRIARVLRLRDDGSIATRIEPDDPLQTLVEMRADPLGAGVLVAGHRADANNPQAGRARIQRLRADGNVDWLWQSGSSAPASSVRHLRVSASAGIYAISSRFLPGFGAQAKDWLAVGLRLDGTQRFEQTIGFDKAVEIVGASAPDAAGVWLTAQHVPDSETNLDRTVWALRLSANGNRGSSHTIRDAEGGCVSIADECRMALRRDGGLWLMVYDRHTGGDVSPTIVGVDGKGDERARLVVASDRLGLPPMGMGLLPDDRALGVVSAGSAGAGSVIAVMRVGFGQPAEPWSQLSLAGRTLPPVEAVASDGAVAQWRSSFPTPSERAGASSLTFRNADSEAVAWRVDLRSMGDMQLSVSRSLVCMAGYLQDFGPLRYRVECRRRADGSVLWQEVDLDAGFAAIRALDDGGAVAVASGLGTLQHWVIDADGQVLVEESKPLLGTDQQNLVLRRAAFNAAGDALLIGFDVPFDNGSLLRLDHDGVERFHTPFVNDTPDNAGVNNQLAFAADGGAIRYGDNVIARYLPTGEKLWEIMPDGLIADLVVDGDTILYSRRAQGNEFPPVTSDWEVVALNSADAGERWRLPLDAPLQRSAGIAVLAPHRLAVLQTERNHLRYREFDVGSGALLREQTDACAGELCGCELDVCKTRYDGKDFILGVALPLQTLADGLRVRVSDFRAGVGWGSGVLLLADAGKAQATVRADQNDVRGAWFAPWSSGQGLMLDWIADGRTLFANWLTFTPSGGNDPSALRWYTLQGELADASTDAEMDILTNEGGRFAVGVTTSRRVGSARLRFERCDRAQFSYRFDPDVNDGLTGVISLTKLVPGAACGGGAVTPSSADAFDSSIDGAWFDPASSGQGVMFSVFPAQDTLFATWFTYDPETAPDDPSQQHWFTLQGPLGSAGQTSLAIIRTTGGALLRLPTGNSRQVGTATVTRLGCDRVQLDYQFDDNEIAGAFRRINGSQTLQRIGGCAN